MYSCQIAKCICRKMQKIFVSNCKFCLCEITNCICLKLQNVFVSNQKTYLCQIAKCICRKMQKYLFQMANCVCVKLQKKVLQCFLSYFCSRSLIPLFHMCFGIRILSPFHPATWGIHIQNIKCPKTTQNHAWTTILPCLRFGYFHTNLARACVFGHLIF